MSDDDKHKFDTLAEYHLHNSDTLVYELVEEIVLKLKSIENDNQDEIANDIIALLTDAKSKKLLQFFCEKYNVSYNQVVFKNNDKHKFVAPKLLLHLLCLNGCFRSANYVAMKLDIDSQEATDLLYHLKQTFTIDNPLIWLENLHNQTIKEHRYHEKYKKDLMHGHDIAQQPKDTAEDRKLKTRRRFWSFFKFWF